MAQEDIQVLLVYGFILLVDDDINIKINENDLRIDTYRSSGAGGQHVNTTDSAVLFGLPTKIVVQCENPEIPT